MKNSPKVANEVMDAMPAHCFRITAEGPKERSIHWQNDRFSWCLTLPPAKLAEKMIALQQSYFLPVGYESEINVVLGDWIKKLATVLKKGIILLVDYGYTRNDYYHPDRSNGTLRCFYQHHYHDDPLVLPGLQDISVHVDFTTVLENAIDAGLSLAGFTTQSLFLLSCGLLELAEKVQLPTVAKFQQNQAIKKLTLPSQMGELVKVMALKKNVDEPLRGFSHFSLTSGRNIAS